MLRRTALIAPLFLLLAACSQPPYTNVGNADLQSLLADGVPLYDIRTAPEWRQTGVVAGSRQITFVDGLGRVRPGFLETLTGEVGPDQPLVLICETGGRTEVLARYLAEKLGYTQVYNVRDGINRWIRDGLPVERG